MDESLEFHIEKIYHHIEVLNHEYGQLCERTAILEAINKLNNKLLWLIMASILGQTLLQFFS